MRPDLKEGGLVDFWIQESLRRICRETNLYRETLSVVAITGFTDSTTVTPTNGYNLKRVEYVRAAVGLFANAKSQGGWNASTNTPAITTGSASAANAGQFYIVTTAGSTNVDGGSTWNIGDIIQSSGAKWVRFPLESFDTMQEVNDPTTKLRNAAPQTNAGSLLQWAQTVQNPTGTIFWYPPSQFDTAVQIVISEVPVGELADIGTLPIEVEDAIVQGALAQILQLPSNKPGLQNLMLAEEYKLNFERSLANLKTRSLFGYGGVVQAIPPNFSGPYSTALAWTWR